MGTHACHAGTGRVGQEDDKREACLGYINLFLKICK